MMTIRTYMPIPVSLLTKYWLDPAHPRPWKSPPVIEVPGFGPFDVRALFLTAASNKAYNLTSHEEFYRIMFRDQYLRLIHENGYSEIIIAAHATFVHPLAPIVDNVVQLFPKPL